MNQPDAEFQLVRRGYEPSEVDREVRALREELGRARETVRRLEQGPSAVGAPTEPASYAHLGERMGQILALAEAEAAQLRDEARADAKQAADQERDAAERDSSARRQEAEAVYEQARAKAAAVAADFETTLAERRERAIAEFQQQQAETRAQLDQLGLQIEEKRALGQREHEAAQQELRQLLQEAEDRAAALVAEARVTADRIRKESDRELAAATQRRDSINQQLGNVRQMLATLTGKSAGDQVGEPQRQPDPEQVPDPDRAG